MTSIQAKDLKTTLTAMFDAIAKKENVADHLLKLDALQRAIAPTAPPQLRHFLERRSYVKALEYLQTGIVIDDPNRPECDEPHP